MTYRWIVIVALLWLLVIVLDELAYYSWKQLNPGSKWSGSQGQNWPFIQR